MSIGSSASKTHLPESLPVTLSNKTHIHLVFLNIFIGFLLNNAYATLTHNTFCSTQPADLHSLLNYHTPTRSLRSANTNLLSVPRVHTAFASRGFSVAAPTVWNSLPSGTCDFSSTHTFRRLLKTYCFQQAFGPLVAHPSASDSASGWHCAL